VRWSAHIVGSVVDRRGCPHPNQRPRKPVNTRLTCAFARTTQVTRLIGDLCADGIFTRLWRVGRRGNTDLTARQPRGPRLQQHRSFPPRLLFTGLTNAGWLLMRGYAQTGLRHRSPSQHRESAECTQEPPGNRRRGRHGAGPCGRARYRRAPPDSPWPGAPGPSGSAGSALRSTSASPQTRITGPPGCSARGRPDGDGVHRRPVVQGTTQRVAGGGVRQLAVSGQQPSRE